MFYITLYRSEGFALTGYDIPGCVEDGAWMLWENSSVAAAVVAVAVARSFLGIFVKTSFFHERASYGRW